MASTVKRSQKSQKQPLAASCGAKTFTDSWLSALSTRLGCDRKVSGNYKEGNLGSWAADNADSTFKSRRWANP